MPLKLGLKILSVLTNQNQSSSFTVVNSIKHMLCDFPLKCLAEAVLNEEP